jgi:hypothetical protein
MPNVYRIPLVAIPQRFAIELNTHPLVMLCRWNGESPAWELSLYDGNTGAPLFESLSLVTGTNLLAPYAYLGLGGSLIVFTDGELSAVPTETNLGTEGNLYFVTE